VYFRPDKLEKHLKDGRRTVYAGVDPTAPSLHVGHLLPLMVLLHFQVRGHFVIPLVRRLSQKSCLVVTFRQIGGATGLVGDPSGRAEERRPADQAKTEHHTTKLERNVATFFDRGRIYAEARLPPSAKIVHKPNVVDNKEWLQQLKLLDFLRTAGVHIRLNTMLARERCVSHSHRTKCMTKMLYAVYDRGWSHKRAYPSPNSRINFYKHLIFSGSTKILIAQYKSVDPINGAIF